MEKLDYAQPDRRRKLPTWLKVSGVFAFVIALLVVIAIAVIVAGLWFAVWLMEKIAPML